MLYICGKKLPYAGKKGGFVSINQTNRIMKKLWLLPRNCRIVGWGIFALCALLGLYLVFTGYAPLQFDFFSASVANVAIIGALVGLVMVAFSKEEVEDEFINSLRMDAMIKAFILNSVVIVLLSLTMYGIVYVYALSLTQYVVLLAYIVFFRYSIRKNLCNNEE